jgi:hypothetical protein
LNLFSPFENFFFLTYFWNFFMKRAISSSSLSEVSSPSSYSSSLELSTTNYLFLLFLFAFKAISWFLVVVMPLERLLT